MLLELRIENLLVIERAELRFGEGLNAITGETGAGKTVLAHSLDLLLGGKARANIVRPGAEEAWVEGTFELPEGALADPALAELAERLPEDVGEVTVGRRVGSSGRTSAFVAGRSASAADLRLLGERLVAFYGQHDHRKLTVAAAQLEVLDGFAGAEHLALRERYRAAHAQARALEAELEQLREREGARERDLDLLRFELEEIEQIGPRPEERIELGSERERLRNAEGLREAASTALGLLDGDGVEDGAASAVAAAGARLSGATGADPQLDGLAERVESVAIELGELATSLRDYGEGLEADPERLAEIEQRLEAIDRLERKHGGTVEAVLEHAGRCRERIAALEHSDQRAAELEAEVERAREERRELAARLTSNREAAASGLEERVVAELSQLAMEGARLTVELEPEPSGFGPWGAETVELRVATNPGMPVSALRDAASGGELSRIMLALSRVGSAAAAPTVVFDEIDAGIGGNTARAVGERLRGLGEQRQVVCITHLPQVASQAGTHFRIVKELAGERATTRVDRVGGDELVAEIVRMLGAESDDRAATEHARELLAA